MALYPWSRRLCLHCAGVNEAVGQKFDRYRDDLGDFGGRRRSTLKFLGELAPQVGLEPTTKRLTAARSTAELLRSAGALIKFSGQDLRPCRQAVNPDQSGLYR